ncbi:polysaccharide deacetylase family protein [Sulfuricurvum sp.]|uniref:polysaccharide deacetylase family protein n=1 Tax=Sulfuricurvum sp. TaxID=2025608 RepID=UPI00260A5CC7|nr:polysaccharide deacetylase family protein [Sulfuricurvum sp.]MDD2781133.1 polysaccharide deacetylase family protein [Sulfuricurvum sp.]
MTQFLNTWRTDTLTPIQSGIYTNVIVNGNPNHKRVALTFDDAPDDNNTDKLLDILDYHGVKAAFFMIARTMVEGNISVVQRTNDEGHLVLNHTLSHPRLSDLNESSIVYQLDHAAEQIESITGHYPLLYRPPYGSINSLVVESTNNHGLTTILWSLDSLDWTLKDSDAVVENVISNVRNGDIILMHRNATSVASLSEMIEELKNKGYLFERLDEMLGIRAYR